MTTVLSFFGGKGRGGGHFHASDFNVHAEVRYWMAQKHRRYYTITDNDNQMSRKREYYWENHIAVQH